MSRLPLIILFFSVLLLTGLLRAEGPVPGSIGEIVLLEGEAELSSFITGERFSIDEHKKVVPGHKIRTDKDTLLDLVLDDGTPVYLKEETSFYLYYLRKKETDPPTKFKIDFGKVRISQGMRYNSKNLEIITPCAVISVVMADFSVIVSENETRILVHKGRVGMESTNMSVKSAYVGTRNEMVSIMCDSPPLEPVIIKRNHKSWLDSFVVTDKFRRIRRKDETQEVLDWVKRKQGAR